jgi:hypothetical protein
MKDSRIGESLWLEWTGDSFGELSDLSTAYFTETYVDLENDVVKRALASALQRDGIAVTLGEGYRLAETAVITYGYAGYIDDSIDLTLCDEDGITSDGDTTDEILEITLAELRWQA